MRTHRSLSLVLVVHHDLQVVVHRFVRAMGESLHKGRGEEGKVRT